MTELGGVLTAMATPFDDEGEVDYDAAARLAVHLLEHGSDGLVVAGSTGEAATLDDAEQIDLLRAVRAEVGDGVALVCGSGTNDTRHSVALTKRRRRCRSGRDAGRHAVLQQAEPGGDEGARRGDRRDHRKPIVLYNIPSRTVINVPPG